MKYPFFWSRFEGLFSFKIVLTKIYEKRREDLFFDQFLIIY